MSSVNNKKIRNEHAKHYIQAVFADRLQAEGFECPDDNLLNWYRIVNKEVIHSICFFSHWSNLPLMMCIAYGVHPLFVVPFHTTDVHVSVPVNDERFYIQTITEAVPKKRFAPYADDILVYAPQADGRGIYTLESIILPQITAVQTIEQCYRFHREQMSKQSGKMTPTIIDEAIYLNDITAYPKCKLSVSKLIMIYQGQCENNPSNKHYKEMLLQLQQQDRALCDNAREEFLLVLEQRTQKTIKLLKKKFGITV